jgi:hypothetical protein
MRYKFAKTERAGVEFILAQCYDEVEGIALRKLIEKYDPDNKNVIIVNKKSDGLNSFAGIDARKFDFFRTTESFEDLDWIEAYIE